jgi:tetratricopeptide (TPR) repeat protein
LHWKIWVLSRLGQLAEAQALGEQALAQARLAEPDSYALARNLNVLGTILDDLGNYAQAAEYKEQALALFRARGDRRWVGNMLNNLGVTAWGQGDYVTTAARYAEALAVAREIGNRDSEPLYLSNLGNARVELGAYHEAEADQRAAIQAAEVQGARGILASAYYGLANALLGQGQVAAALGAAQEALAHAQAVGYLKDVAVAWRTLGQVRARMASPLVLDGRAYDAPACFAESLQISTERGMDGERARTLRAWAEYAWAQGDHERGRAMWQEARDIFARVGATFEVARMGPAPGAPAAAPE